MGFFPWKLISVLNSATVPAEGLYMENCKFVEWGYFGNLEVFSKQAFATLVTNLDECYTSLPWKVGVHGGKHGPMGEDLFAQKCMDLMGVAKQENFGLTTDGACEADRPTEERKNKSLYRIALESPLLPFTLSRSPRRTASAGLRRLQCTEVVYAVPFSGYGVSIDRSSAFLSCSCGAVISLV